MLQWENIILNGCPKHHVASKVEVTGSNPVVPTIFVSHSTGKKTYSNVLILVNDNGKIV